MNWAQAFAGVEQALGIVAVAGVLLLVVVWGAIKAELLSDEVPMRHEGRTRRRR